MRPSSRFPVPEPSALPVENRRAIWLEVLILALAALAYGFFLRWPLISLEGEVGEVFEQPDTQNQDNPSQVRMLIPPRSLLPVDDPYIFIRHAQQIARGRPYQWTDGEVSTGASSLVYPWLLLPGQWLFDDVWGWSRWSTWVGTLCLWLAAWAAAYTVRQIGLPPPWPLAVGLTLIFSGPIAWVSIGGMDSALGCAALLGACGLWIRTTSDPTRKVGAWALMVWIALLPWVRPDFALATGLAAVAVTLGRGPAVARFWGPLLLVPGICWAIANWWLTGSASPAGVLAKSALSSPFVSFTAAVEIVGALVGRHLLGVYAGTQPRILPPPAGVLAVLTALAVLMVALGRRPIGFPVSGLSSQRLRASVPVASAWFCALVSTSLSGYMSWQYFRHHHPGLVCVWVMAAVGAHTATKELSDRLFRNRSISPPALRWAQALVLTLPFALLGRAPDWAYDYFQSAVQFYQDNGMVAEWLNRNRNEEVLLVHDAGLLALAHDGPVVDLMGLGTTKFALPYRDGSGAVVEQLARHTPPPRFAAGKGRLLRIDGLLGPPYYEAPSRRYWKGGMLIAPLRLERLENTVLTGRGVDFGDVESEQRHALRWDPPPRPLQASFALAYFGADGRVQMQGCRPLHTRLSVRIPDGVRQATLRWTAQPGHSGRLSLRTGLDGQEVESAMEKGEPRWFEIRGQVAAGSARVFIENAGDGEPCLESLAFS